MIKNKRSVASEELFWNDPKTVEWFSKEPAPEYWKQFFLRVKKDGVQTVLDLGCGAGRNTQLLFDLGYDVYACDLYLGMIKATKLRLKKMGIGEKEIEKRVIMASMLNLPYGDNFFDAVISNGVYHNVATIAQIDQALKETARVLKAKGYLCFNLFSSNIITEDFKRMGENVYLTKENLPMALLSKQRFLALSKKYNLILTGKVAEYEREVSTGKRSVMRGVLQKKFCGP